MLKGKNILLAVTGSIAAYKAALIIREFIKKEANVKVIMTEASFDFITPVTLSTLSKNPVIKDFVKSADTGEWNNHVDLGLWADAIVIAPATANSISKFTTGHADSFMMATYLSARCQVFIAPAMDLDMYAHKSTQDNLSKLNERGDIVIYPESGELASGLSGQGRLAEPENIIKAVENHIKEGLTLSGKRILITAGPTHEPIDPVRYIGNRSSGKMGLALVDACLERGAQVTLISGPIGLEFPNGCEVIKINTAAEMLQACKDNYDQDIVIMAAAVADYTPEVVHDEKVKKSSDSWQIKLKKTEDILQWMGENKKEQKLIGFALETENEEVNALKKIEKKNLDAIVLNSLSDKGAGFRTDTNKVTIIHKNNNKKYYELKSKSEVASDILDEIEMILEEK